MQDVNLQNLVSALVTASGKSTAPASGNVALLAPLPAITLTQSAQATTIRNQQNQVILKLLSAPIPTIKDATAAVTADAQQLAVFSQPKSLFSTQLSAQQFAALLQSFVQQPGIGKLLQSVEAPVTIQSAKIFAISGQTVSVKLDNSALVSEPIRLNVGELAKQLSIGQNVNVQIRQVGNQWQAVLVTALPKSISSSTPAPNQTVSQPTTLKASSPLPSGIIQQQLKQGITLNNVPTVAQTLGSAVGKDVLALLQDGMRTAGVKADLRITENRQLQLTATLPIARVDLPKVGNETGLLLQQTLGKLPITYERIAAPFFKLSPAQQQQFIKTIQRLPTASPSIPLAKSEGNLQFTSSEGSVTLKSTSTANTESVVKPNQTKRVEIPEQLAAQISKQARNTFINSETATVNRQSLDNMLTAMAKNSDPAIKQLGERFQQVVSPLLTKLPEPTQIQQLLQLPAIPVSMQNISTPQPSNNLVNGLVAMLQLSLATRFNRSEQSTVGQDKLIQIMNTIVSMNTPTASKSTATRATPRSGIEFSQLEQRHQLLRSLTRLLNGHQFNKLSQAEASSQGQETLFYALPNPLSQQHRDIELLIKREPEERQTSQNTKGNRDVWHLTMLLSAGDAGDVLAKCRLQEDELGLDLYTSNEALRIKVLEHLSHLRKRLAKFGLDVVSSQCQLGVIPDSLKPKPYQLLNTRA